MEIRMGEPDARTPFRSRLPSISTAIPPSASSALLSSTASGESTPTVQSSSTRARRTLSTSALRSPLLTKHPSFQGRPKHRHSHRIEHSLELLKTLSEQATTGKEDLSTGIAEDEDVKNEPTKEEGVIGNLESHGWLYHGQKSGVRIFSREDDGIPFLLPDDNSETLDSASTLHGSSSLGVAGHHGGPPSILAGASINSKRPSSNNTSAIGANGRKKQAGVRSDESMPFFRGEAWIEGSWRIDDVAATMRSFGARAIWDPRFGLNSSVVQALSDSDMLTHMYIKGSFPVGDRDASLVSTFFHDHEQHMGFVAASSCEDSLIPKFGTRSTVHLNGFCIRALPRSPYFESPPPTSSSSLEDASSPPPVGSRPAHRRTKSTMSMVGNIPNLGASMGSPNAPAGTPLPIFEPLQTIMPTLNRRQTYVPPPTSQPAPLQPPPLQHRFSSGGNSQTKSRASTSWSGGGGNVQLVSSTSEEPLEYSINAPDAPTSMYSQEVSNRPGLHISFIIRASPGGNLPQTYVNQLSLNLPLSLASIERYLLSNGFAPYISNRRKGLDVREEHFDPASGLYEVVYRVDESIAHEDTRIRFWGSTFSRGRFNVEVSSIEDWTIEYDYEPDEQPEIIRLSASPLTLDDSPLPSQANGFHAPPPPQQRKSSLSILSSPPLESTKRTPISGVGQTNADSADVDSADPAKLRGPKGGCCLVIPNSGISGGLVSVTISKASDMARSGVERMKWMSEALGKAAKASLESHACETIEQLLDSSHGDGLALSNLRAAIAVQKEFGIGRQREQEAISKGIETLAPLGYSTRAGGTSPAPPPPRPSPRPEGAGGRKRSASVTISQSFVGMVSPPLS